MNTGRQNFTPDLERQEEVLRWYLWRRSQLKLPRAVSKQWRTWAEDPANVAEIRDLSCLHAMLLRMPPPALPSGAELRADSSSAESDAPDDANSIAETDLQHRPRSWRFPIYLAVGCATAAVIAFLWVSRYTLDLPLDDIVTVNLYEIPPGIPREVTLRDRSVAILSGSARLTAVFSAHRRYLHLQQGEALFKVRHDPAAPLQVRAGNGTIEDLGTTFNVHCYPDLVFVSVLEGAVRILPETHATSDNASIASPSGAGPRQPSGMEVRGGQEVSYDGKGEVSLPHANSRAAVTSWLSGRRVYQGRPLGKVIEDVQLYLPLQIKLDPALATVRFSGSIDKLDPNQAEQWINGLPNIFPVEINKDTKARRLTIRCILPGCPGVPR